MLEIRFDVLGSAAKPLCLNKKDIKPMKFLAVINVLLWSVFLWMDKVWNDFQSDAVARKEGIYNGDWFGPLSYFRPKILFLSYAATLVLAAIIFYSKKNVTKA